MIKFTQDILTGLYNMTKDKDENIIEPFDLKKKKEAKMESE